MDEEAVRERAERYVRNLKGIIPSLEPIKPIELAKQYLSDSEYYLAKGDYVSSIVCSSYAEGIIDGLRENGTVSASWKTDLLQEKSVVAAGTWDIIHPGHIKLLEFAASLGDLTVIVSRDKNATKAKGHTPMLPEQQRLAVVSALKPVKKAILGSLDGDPVRTVADLKPDFFVLGPDQPYDERELEQKLKSYGCNTKVIRFNQRFTSPGLITSTSKIVEAIRARNDSEIVS